MDNAVDDIVVADIDFCLSVQSVLKVMTLKILIDDAVAIFVRDLVLLK